MNNDKKCMKSMIAQYINDFINEYKLGGYRFKIQDRWMRQFDLYCWKHSIDINKLNKELLLEYCYRNANESLDTVQKRVTMMRKFALFLIKNDINIEVPSKPTITFKCPKHIPYIFTPIELKELFTQIDNWKWTSLSRGYRREIDPLLFRMLYGCGLRVMEALRLKVSDVDIIEGNLYIYDSKNGRNRIVPMNQSLIIRCKRYLKLMHFSSDSNHYLFPGNDRHTHSSHSATYHRFREYLWKARIAHSGNGPRIHDLRHTFCVHRLKKWVLEGCELTNFLPYLSAYLGHVNFRGTEYYLKLTSDLYPEIITMVKNSHGNIIPNLEVQNGK